MGEPGRKTISWERETREDGPAHPFPNPGRRQGLRRAGSGVGSPGHWSRAPDLGRDDRPRAHGDVGLPHRGRGDQGPGARSLFAASPASLGVPGSRACAGGPGHAGEVAGRQAAEALDAPAASLTLWDRETDTLRIVASHGLSEEYVRGQVIPAERARQAGEAAGWKPFVVPERAAQGLGGEELAAREGLRTMLVVPLQVGQGWPGSLNIYTKEEGRTFSEEEIALAEAAGQQIAAALHNARLYQKAQRRLEEMAALRNLALQMAEPQPLEALLQRTVEEAAQLMGMDAGSLYLLDEGTGRLVLAAAHNVRTYSLWSQPLAVREGLCGRVAATGEPLAVEAGDAP
ncbi:MAG: GAF domain-containing protein, partial [Anaerolineae bacterium]|nr:GAF domain-containing protein [Anaerolineae bacterium]